MTESQLERGIHKKILDALIYVIDYFRIECAVIFHPRRTLAEAFRNKGSKFLHKTGAFLLANFVLSFLILGGDPITEFPFKIPWLSNQFGESFILVARYVVGIAVFLGLLQLLIKRSKVRVSSSRTFSVICYASAIFIPCSLVKRVCNQLLGQIFIDTYSSLLSQRTVNLETSDYITLAVWLATALLSILWWLWLVYLGLRSIGIERVRRLKALVLLSYFIFFGLQSLTSVASFISAFKPVFQSAVSCREIKEALSKDPPDYFKAAFLSEQIAKADFVPPYPRYFVVIRKIACYMRAYADTPLFDDIDHRIVDEALENIWNRDCEKARHILVEHLGELSADKTNPWRSFYLGWIKQLEEAGEFRDSPQFIENQDEIFVFVMSSPCPLIALFPWDGR